MELTLLGSVGLAAFLICGGAVLLFISFRRTIELRGALIQAMRRIERLEQALATGAPLAANADAPPNASPPIESTAESTFTAAATNALEADRINPPHLGLTAILMALIAFSALAAGQFREISGQAGVELGMLAGLIVLVMAEWRRRADRASEAANASLLPNPIARTGLYGLTIMAASLLYGWAVMHAVPGNWALLGMSAIALGAAGLAFHDGPALAIFAIVTGAAAPALAPFDSHAPPLRYFLLAALTVVLMFLARRRNATLWTWAAALIALGWGANGAAWGGGASLVSAIAAYFAVLAAFGLLSAWDGAGVAPFPQMWRGNLSAARIAGGALFAGAAAGLVLLSLAHVSPTASVGPGFVALAMMAMGTLAARPGLWFASFIALIASAIAIAFWPAAADGVPDAPGLVILAAALALVFSLGGAAAMAGAKDPRPGATLAALSPVLLFAAAQEHIGGFGAREYWAAAALTIAALDALVFVQIARAKPEASHPFAMGAAIAFAAALYAATPPPFAPLALALSLPLIALTDRWRQEPGLHWAGLALGALLLARLIAPEVFVLSASGPPLLAELFLPSAFAVLVASILYARGSSVAQTSLALAFVLAASFATLQARNFFTAGAIGAPYANLAECGFNTLIWLGLATLLAWQFGPKPRTYLFALEWLALAAAMIHVFIAGVIALNPWWGLTPSEATGWRGLDLIELAFAAPALVLLVYAQVRRRQNMTARAGAAEAFGFALLLLAIVLELRRLFHGAAMAQAAVTTSEAWAYSLAGLGFAALLYALSISRKRRALRYTAITLAVTALGKMALSDIAVLEGALRLVVFAILAALAGGLIWLGVRDLLPPGLLRAPARPKNLADPNLNTPPG